MLVRLAIAKIPACLDETCSRRLSGVELDGPVRRPPASSPWPARPQVPSRIDLLLVDAWRDSCRLGARLGSSCDRLRRKAPAPLALSSWLKPATSLARPSSMQLEGCQAIRPAWRSAALRQRDLRIAPASTASELADASRSAPPGPRTGRSAGRSIALGPDLRRRWRYRPGRAVTWIRSPHRCEACRRTRNGRRAPARSGASVVRLDRGRRSWSAPADHVKIPAADEIGDDVLDHPVGEPADALLVAAEVRRTAGSRSTALPAAAASLARPPTTILPRRRRA